MDDDRGLAPPPRGNRGGRAGPSTRRSPPASAAEAWPGLPGVAWTVPLSAFEREPTEILHPGFETFAVGLKGAALTLSRQTQRSGDEAAPAASAAVLSARLAAPASFGRKAKRRRRAPRVDESEEDEDERPPPHPALGPLAGLRAAAGWPGAGKAVGGADAVVAPLIDVSASLSASGVRFRVWLRPAFFGARAAAAADAAAGPSARRDGAGLAADGDDGGDGGDEDDDDGRGPARIAALDAMDEAAAFGGGEEEGGEEGEGGDAPDDAAPAPAPAGDDDDEEGDPVREVEGGDAPPRDPPSAAALLAEIADPRPWWPPGRAWESPDPPGLSRPLFPHQRRALAWCRWREAGAKTAPREARRAIRGGGAERDAAAAAAAAAAEDDDDDDEAEAAPVCLPRPHWPPPGIERRVLPSGSSVFLRPADGRCWAAPDDDALGSAAAGPDPDAAAAEGPTLDRKSVV